jgi:hypothetical protein
MSQLISSNNNYYYGSPSHTVVINRDALISLSPLFIPNAALPKIEDKIQIRNEKPLITFLCPDIFTCDEICPGRRFMEDVQTARPRAS